MNNQQTQSARRKARSAPPHGSAATSNNTNLWRRYRLTHVTVAWQERHAGIWFDYSKQITHEQFAKHYTQVPPNARISDPAKRRVD
jgi:hypothetical protein